MPPQELTITVKFLVEHSPGSESHLIQILTSFLKAKGIELKDKTIEL